MKDFSNWKTYPQIYQHGTLVGGLDTIKAMKDTEGNLNQLVNSGTAVDTAVKNAASKAESQKILPHPPHPLPTNHLKN